MKLTNTVQTVLIRYVNLLEEHLLGTVEWIYLHGSIAINAFVENKSDIDFITITNRPLTESDYEVVNEVHNRLAREFNQPEMDGVYITKEDIGKIYRSINDHDKKFLYYNNTKLMYGDYFNFNPVTWWIFKHNGMTYIGPDSKTFKININEDELCKYVYENMNSYWATRLKHIENSIDKVHQSSSHEIDEEVEWTVLGMLRQFYTLREKSITSKVEAGEYGLLHIPVKFHGIINDAISIRISKEGRIIDSKVDRVHSVINLGKYIINESKSLIKNKREEELFGTN